MDKQKISRIRCPQCNSVCEKTLSPITEEYSIDCHVCGYQEFNALTDKKINKGYGSLVINDIAISFHEPIPFKDEQEILKGIMNNPSATFIKWTDEFGLTVLKGELPEDLTDEEENFIKELISEEEYYNSFKTSVTDNSDIPFDNSSIPFFN